MADKFEVACLLGTSTIAYIEIDSQEGKFKREELMGLMG